MKKILTLVLSLGIFTVAFAQGNRHKSWNDKDYAYSGSYDRYGNHYDQRNDSRNYSVENQRAFEIQRVNQNYNYQVMSIQNNRYMRNHQKKVAFRNAQRDRDHQILRINEKYNRMNRNWSRR